jgi:2-phospho-L-lactate guanylyltransferase (CobY/MobA/RfbA family)
MTRLVVLPIDLPGATADALLDVLAEPAAVSIVPDRDGDGTNLLALDATAMTAFEFGYGPASCERHRREAERLGLAARLSPHPLLAMDIDRPEDYRRWIGATEWKRESNKK